MFWLQRRGLPTWLALLVPPAMGYTVFVVGHLLLTAVGMARLARGLGAGGIGSSLAALVWTFFFPTPGQIPHRFGDLKKVAFFELFLDHRIPFLVIAG